VASRKCVIGITHVVGDDDFEFLLDADDGGSSPSFCSLNLDDFCGVVSIDFFNWLTSWIKLLESWCPFA
jgi:hypothetical protein